MSIDARLERLERLVMLGAKNVLNTEETALLLGITPDRLRHLTHERKIPYYKQGNRVYFHKSEIEQWQMMHRIPSDEELNYNVILNTLKK